MSFSLHGVSASKGIAIGQVRVLERSQFEVREYGLTKRQIEPEIRRYQSAVDSVRRH